jgi:hypothetical protein
VVRRPAWHYGAECVLGDVLPLLGEGGFPRLRALRLMNAVLLRSNSVNE